MGMQKPEVSEPLDKLSDEYPEGTPFYLIGVRIVKARTADFGEGEMVVVKVRDHTRELGVWGSYLLAQARSLDDSDLNKWWRIERNVVEGFGKGRPVKMFVPADVDARSQERLPSGDQTRITQPEQQAGSAAVPEDDIPF